VATLRFFISELGSPRYAVDEDRFIPLGMWLVMDLGSDPTMGLDALAMLDDVVAGRSASETWEGEGFDVTFTLQKVEVVGIHVEARAEYSLPETREAVEQYWGFASRLPENPDTERLLRPDLPYWQASLLDWERIWKRSHPYRGRLGIPTEGPS
jgi:hypothetical protein